MTEQLATDAAGIARAALLLRSGALVAFGTETVYGLGADATDPAAVAAVFAAKGRPGRNPLICHYPEAAAAFAEVIASPVAERFAEAFWPGPLTLVLPRRESCPVAPIAGAGLPTLAVRVPAHPVAAALLRAVGRPIAAPSANRSGGVSPTTAAHVLAELGGRIAAVLDSGPCAVGLESSVVDLTRGEPVLLRPGGIPAEMLAAIAGPLGRGFTPGAAPPGGGRLTQSEAEACPRRSATAPPAGRSAPPPPTGLPSPGLLPSHYAPWLPLRLDIDRILPTEALLAFGPPLNGAALSFQLSAGGDLAEAAARLFAGLRWLDTEGQRRGLTGIAAMPIPETGLGEAIRDRLRRAAAPRPERAGDHPADPSRRSMRRD